MKQIQVVQVTEVLKASISTSVIVAMSGNIVTIVEVSHTITNAQAAVRYNGHNTVDQNHLHQSRKPFQENKQEPSSIKR